MPVDLSIYGPFRDAVKYILNYYRVVTERQAALTRLLLSAEAEGEGFVRDNFLAGVNAKIEAEIPFWRKFNEALADVSVAVRFSWPTRTHKVVTQNSHYVMLEGAQRVLSSVFTHTPPIVGIPNLDDLTAGAYLGTSIVPDFSTAVLFSVAHLRSTSVFSLGEELLTYGVDVSASPAGEILTDSTLCKEGQARVPHAGYGFGAGHERDEKTDGWVVRRNGPWDPYDCSSFVAEYTGSQDCAWSTSHAMGLLASKTPENTMDRLVQVKYEALKLLDPSGNVLLQPGDAVVKSGHTALVFSVAGTTFNTLEVTRNRKDAVPGPEGFGERTCTIADTTWVGAIRPKRGST
jgi:hypothetical protein